MALPPPTRDWIRPTTFRCEELKTAVEGGGTINPDTVWRCAQELLHWLARAHTYMRLQRFTQLQRTVALMESIAQDITAVFSNIDGYRLWHYYPSAVDTADRPQAYQVTHPSLDNILQAATGQTYFDVYQRYNVKISSPLWTDIYQLFGKLLPLTGLMVRPDDTAKELWKYATPSKNGQDCKPTTVYGLQAYDCGAGVDIVIWPVSDLVSRMQYLLQYIYQKHGVHGAGCGPVAKLENDWTMAMQGSMYMVIYTAGNYVMLGQQISTQGVTHILWANGTVLDVTWHFARGEAARLCLHTNYCAGLEDVDAMVQVCKPTQQPS